LKKGVKKPGEDVKKPAPAAAPVKKLADDLLPVKKPKREVEVFENDPIVPGGFDRFDVAPSPPGLSFPAGFTAPDPAVARGVIPSGPIQFNGPSRAGRRPPPDLSHVRVIRPVSAPQRQDVSFDATLKRYEDTQARLVHDFEATFEQEIGRLDSQLASLSEAINRSHVALERRKATALSPFERVVDERRTLELGTFVLEHDPEAVLRESGAVRQPILVTFFELICKFDRPDLVQASAKWAAVFLAELDPGDPAVKPVIKGLMAAVTNAFAGTDTQDAKIVFHLAKSLAV
jgi:hypothetical protein